ncbi:MAG: GFA family protein [Pirellulales bacterium]|nr:GFA family protein [Pirellulales bacterium]
MGDSGGRTGGCLCGKVRYKTTKPVDTVSVCHCDMCRRWNGGPAFAFECEKAVEFEGADNIVHYRSSDWAERGFCGICGSNLYYRFVESGYYSLNVGTLDDQSGLTLENQIFIDEKPDFYRFANETTMMTGEEIFALYAPPEYQK